MDGMLTGSAIHAELCAGKLHIDPYNPENLNPNSYNLHIGELCKLVMCNDYSPDGVECINPKKPMEYQFREISKNGFVLMPNNLYLVPTKESVWTDHYIPIITGRSSSGRMGIQIHREAGFGDIGFRGVWTLQLSVVHPTVIFPGMSILQVYFMTPSGEIGKLYKGKYQDATGAEVSKFFEEL